MKRIDSKIVDSMTIFGVGLAIGWFGLTLIEKQPSVFPIFLDGVGYVLIFIGLVYCLLSLLNMGAKDDSKKQ